MILSIAMVAAAGLSAAGAKPDTWPGREPVVIPKPVSLERGGDRPFLLSRDTALVAGGRASAFMLDQATCAIRAATGLGLTSESAGTDTIRLLLNDAIGQGLPGREADEAYRLAVSADGETVEITARTPHGLFDGIQTLAQLANKGREGDWWIPPVRIDDYPRFSWRGYLVDSARHFRPKAELMRIVDLMAFHKLDVLHLHLVDDQGWRIEIKRYPKLTAVGAAMPDYTGATGPGRYYSQSDIKEIVAYAAARFVQVVPEIEMPGHSGAATTAYPELSCDGKPAAELCVTKESTFKFVTGVLDEVVALFPSPFVHIGSDEVQPDNWRSCPSCGKRLDALASARPSPEVQAIRVDVTDGAGRPYDEDAARLQGEFVRRIDRYLAGKGKRMVGWDEILEGGLDKSSRAVVTAWRSPAAVAAALREDRDVVVCLYPECYLDDEASLSQTYALEPCPPGEPESRQAHVLGVQAAMWGESTVSEDDVDRSTWPRLCALAEVGWSPRERRDYGDFLSRLGTHCLRLRPWGIVFGIPMGG